MNITLQIANITQKPGAKIVYGHFVLFIPSSTVASNNKYIIVEYTQKRI